MKRKVLLSVILFLVSCALLLAFGCGQPINHVTTTTSTITTTSTDTSTSTGTTTSTDTSTTATGTVTSTSTSTTLDTVRPCVISRNPGNGTVDVSINSSVSAIFSKAMDDSTISTSSFTLVSNEAPVAGTVIYNSDSFSVLFTPSTNLAYNTTYTATIAASVKDLVGNEMGTDNYWSFTTGTTADVTLPTIESVLPVNGAVDVPVDSVVCAVFSKDMDATTINRQNFRLRKGGISIEGNVSYDATARTAYFVPSEWLMAGVTCTATVKNAVKDLSGNALASNYNWSFTVVSVTSTTTTPSSTTTSLTTTSTSVTTTTIGRVATPSVSPPAGSYEANTLTITIECSTPSSHIFYSLDGTMPTTEYSSPFTIEASKTIKAVALKAGMITSEVITRTFDLYWWQALGAGANGVIGALYFNTAEAALYVGGGFSSAGGLSVNNIAKYDVGSGGWSDLASGCNGNIMAIRSDSSGGTYVGGQFLKAGGTDALHIARWNTISSNWSTLEAGIGGFYVTSLGADPTSRYFYAGGHFTSTGSGIPANRIAKWDSLSQAWSALGSGLDDYVAAVKVDNAGDVYVGGNFENAGGATAKHVAKWNSSSESWSALGASGVDFYVKSLMLDNVGNVYVGGSYGLPWPYPGGPGCITKWDIASSTWSVVGSGENDEIDAIAFDSAGNLYAGGTFITFEGSSLNYIAKKDAITGNWSSLGNGLNNQVSALAFDNSGNLYAGGAFTSAGGIAANRIAKWGKKH